MWMVDPDFVPSDIYRSPTVNYMLTDNQDDTSNKSPTAVVQASTISEQGPTQEQQVTGPKDVNAEQNGNLQPVEVQNKIRNIIEKCKSEQQTLAELANENLKFLEEICNKYKPQPEPFEPSPPLQQAEPTTSFLEDEKLPEFEVAIAKPKKKSIKSLSIICNKYKPQPISADGILEGITGNPTKSENDSARHQNLSDTKAPKREQ